jgi:vacuolar-type H+-ATPase subunit I/STV1
MSSPHSESLKKSRLLLSPEELEKKEKLRVQILERKKKEFSKCAENILEYSTKVSKISGQLKQKRTDEKDYRVSTMRHLTHHKTLEIDRGRRPSDRDYEIRNYSKMDMDVWRYDQVRNWFNSYATDPEPYRYVPSEVGYTLKADG